MKTFKEMATDGINEAVDAQKVYDYFLSTMNNIKNEGSTYSKSQDVVDSLKDNILNKLDDKKLKAIEKQLTKIANDLGSGLDKLEGIL